MIHPRTAFEVRDFRLLTQARFLFSFAVQLQAVIMGWQVYEIKHDPLYLGLIGLVEAVPAISVALVSGYVVDRSNPLRIYINVLRCSLLSALVLLAVTSGWIRTGGDGALPWIYLAALITGFARGFSGPALFALVPQLISRESLRVSAAWVTGAFQIAAVTGPAVGGIIYAWNGPRPAYLLGCLALAGATLSLHLIRHEPKVVRSAESSPLLERLTSGMRYVWGHQLLLSALALDMFAVLFGGVVAVLPLFAAEILHAGPRGLGLLRSAPSLGAMIMSAWLIRRPVGRHAGALLLSVVAGFGLCMIAFGLSRWFWLSAGLLLLSGALDSVSMVIRSAIVQLCSPEDMRGRIAAVNSIFIGSSNEIGAFESGLAAKMLGTVPSVIFGGCMTLLTVITAALAAPRLRALDLTQLE